MKPSKLFSDLILTAILAFQVSSVHAQSIPQLSRPVTVVWTSDRTSWLEGPSYDGAGGIWFADPGNILTDFAEPARVLRYDIATGNTTTELEFDGGLNVFGTAFDAKGRLLSTEISPTQTGIMRRATDKLAIAETLAAVFEGMPLLPNDLVFDAAGGLYFTDWKQNNPELGDSAVYYLSTGGELAKATAVPQATSANGIGISPDGETLYVARPFAGGVFAYDIEGPGILTNERMFAVVPGATDGLTVDRHGNVFVSDLAADPTAVPPVTPGLPDSMVRAFSPVGEELVAFHPPGGAINLAFDNEDHLYIAGWDNLSRASIRYVPEPLGHGLLIVGIACSQLLFRRRRGSDAIAHDAIARYNHALR